MTLDETRAGLASSYEALDEWSREAKDPWILRKGLARVYGRLDSDERQLADVVISEWVLSRDARHQVAAQYIIREFCIREAIPALRRRVRQLAGETGGPARDEREIVEQLISDLRDDVTPR